jgi:hypothetical protein
MEDDNGLLAREKLQLEVEKARLENERIRNENRWPNKLREYIPVITALVAVVGVLIGIYQFNTQQASAQIQLQTQAKLEFETRQAELKRRYWEEQVTIYRDATQTAAAIAISESLDEVREERRNFWTLYWGEMSLLEHREVEQAMVAFGKQLAAWEASQEKPELIENYAFDIAHCCRKSLLKTWSPVDMEDYGGRCPY